MKPNAPFLKRYALPIYLILAPLISLAIALLLPLLTVLIVLLVLLVPSALAILLVALTEGRRGVSDLLKKLFQWNISLKWYVAALLVPLGIIFVSAILAFLFGWIPTLQFHIPPLPQLITNLILIILIAVLEELGWRGFALPRLLANRSPLASALIIGILWGVLHIGIGLADGRPWLPTFLTPFGLSVIITCLFVHTKGSLALAMLFHFMMDYLPQFLLSELSIEQAVWVQAIASLVLAFFLILIFGVNLQRNPVDESALIDAV